MILENPQRRERNAGIVVSVDDEIITVATSRGPVSARRTDATAYKVGDRARISNGQAVGRLRARSTIVRI